MRYFTILTFLGDTYCLPGECDEEAIASFQPLIDYVNSCDETRFIHYWIAPAVLLTDDPERDMTMDELKTLMPVMSELLEKGFVRIGDRVRFDMPGALPEPFEDYYGLTGAEREEYIKDRDMLEAAEERVVNEQLAKGATADEALDALYDYYKSIYGDAELDDEDDEPYDDDEDYEDEDVSAEAINALDSIGAGPNSGAAAKGTVYNYAVPDDDDLVLPGE